MNNFALRRTDAARFLAQTQMGWFGLLESRTEGISATELVERHLYWKDGSRLTQVRGKQQDADSAEDKAD